MMGQDHWDYCEEGECGPCHWPNANGLHQSPINIDFGCVKQVNDCEPLQFRHYNIPIHGEIVNNGHAVQVTPKFAYEVPEVSGGGLDQTYRLLQYHFHWSQNDHEGSEHTLAGLHYPVELHLVHKGVTDPDKIAVFAVFLIVGKTDDALRVETDVLKEIIEPSKTTGVRYASVEHKLPENKKSFWRYSGSLTTPPCSECVTWTIFTEPVAMTKDQLSTLRRLHDKPGHVMEKNYRPVQKLNDRELLQINTK